MRHTDLKASNVLLSKGWRACVSDLGMAQMVGQEPRSAAGFTATHAGGWGAGAGVGWQWPHKVGSWLAGAQLRQALACLCPSRSQN